MKVLGTEEELKDWTEYRFFLRRQVKALTDVTPIYVSKDKLEFDIKGRTWKGHAVLTGKHASLAARQLKKSGITFREGSCVKDGKHLTVTEGLSKKLVREAQKTFQKLKLGCSIEAEQAS